MNTKAKILLRLLDEGHITAEEVVILLTNDAVIPPQTISTPYYAPPMQPYYVPSPYYPGYPWGTTCTTGTIPCNGASGNTSAILPPGTSITYTKD